MDTVRLLLSTPERLNSENSPFKNLQFEGGYRKSWLNGEDYQDAHKGYFPSVTYEERMLADRGYGITHDLKIEFSVPKLIFGNNLYEVTEKDFDRVISVLSDRLNTMGLGFITAESLKAAKVIRLDVCKNIIFDNKSDIFSIAKILRQGNLGSRFLSFNDAYIDGMSFGFKMRPHKNNRCSEKLTFYDKVAELKHRNIMLDHFNGSILRVENRVVGATTIKNRFKAVHIDISGQDEPKFESIFKQDVWKALLNGRLEELYKTIPETSVDIGLQSLYFNIMRDEVDKRGGYARANQRFAVAVMLTSSGITGADYERYIESLWGKDKKYKMHKIRDIPIMQHQVELLRKMKDDLSNFLPVKESVKLRIKYHK